MNGASTSPNVSCADVCHPPAPARGQAPDPRHDDGHWPPFRLSLPQTQPSDAECATVLALWALRGGARALDERRCGACASVCHPAGSAVMLGKPQELAAAVGLAEREDVGALGDGDLQARPRR